MYLHRGWKVAISDYVFWTSPTKGGNVPEGVTRVVVIGGEAEATSGVRHITNWGDAGTGSVDGELLIWEDTIGDFFHVFRWDASGSEWIGVGGRSGFAVKADDKTRTLAVEVEFA